MRVVKLLPFFVVVSMLMVSACDRTGSKGGDSAKAVTDTGGTGSTATRQPALRNMPTVEGNDLDRYLDLVLKNDLQWPADADDMGRLALVSFPCNSCGTEKRAHFLVVPTKVVHSEPWEEYLVDSKELEAHIVAALINIDSVAVPELGNLPKGDPMFLWVGHVANADARGIGLYAYHKQEKKHYWVSGTKTFQACTDPEYPRPRSAVKLNSSHQCTGASKDAGGGPLPPPLPNLRGPDNLWISCSGGCCKSAPIADL